MEADDRMPMCLRLPALLLILAFSIQTSGDRVVLSLRDTILFCSLSEYPASETLQITLCLLLATSSEVDVKTTIFNNSITRGDPLAFFLALVGTVSGFNQYVLVLPASTLRSSCHTFLV